MVFLVVVMGCLSVSPSQTIRDPQMNYLEFIARADLMVQKLFPEWYVEDTPIGVSFEEFGLRFADVTRLPDGRLAINIYSEGWNLATVEDLASVLLHEYVHVRIWDELEESIPEAWCRSAVHELTANRVELNQTKINVTEGMREATRIAYSEAYEQGLFYCFSEIMKDFPIP